MKNYSREYETDKAFDGAFKIGKEGVAYVVLGWQVEADEDTEWSGMMNRTGKLVCVMVGDDSKYLFEPEDLTAIDEDDYCSGCGQIGHCC